MIARAVERGVAPTVIAEALGLDVASIHRKFRLLDGICPEAAEILKDTICPMNAFDVLRRMSPTRQIEAADLMVGLTADRMAARGVAPVAVARVILTLHATTPKLGLLRGDAAKSAMGVR